MDTPASSGETIALEGSRSVKATGKLAATGILLTVSGKSTGKTAVLTKDICIIGRDSESDLQLDDQMVSKVHATVSKGKRGEYLIRDNSSTNGTFVNGGKVKPAKTKELTYGDRIICGDTVLRFFLQESL